jgi:hypothetical protein
MDKLFWASGTLVILLVAGIFFYNSQQPVPSTNQERCEDTISKMESSKTPEKEVNALKQRELIYLPSRYPKIEGGTGLRQPPDLGYYLVYHESFDSYFYLMHQQPDGESWFGPSPGRISDTGCLRQI